MAVNQTHVRLTETAEQLIIENGRELTLREMVASGSSYDPTLTPSDVPVVGVVFAYRKDEIKGPVQVGDKKVLLKAGTVLNEKMKIVDGGKTFDIEEIEQIKPGEVGILYKLRIRA